MAYLAFTQEQDASAGASVNARPVHDATAPARRFSALEWSVIAIAQNDRLSSLRLPGRLSMALGALFGEGHNPRLADPQLEALRRMAVLSWHRGYAVAPAEVRAFTEAGYSLDHYETLLDSIHAARAERNKAKRR